MATLYRVFPYLMTAAPDDPGGALYVPGQGGGRIDNPGVYSTFYASDAAAGAVAEAFGRFPEWSEAMLAGSPSLAGSVRGIGRYRIPESSAVCDLDDPAVLVEFGLRPSEVVTRDYDRSRSWARRIWETRRWAGVRWWSYYDPRWGSFGLWNVRSVAVEEVRPLRMDDPEVEEAAGRIVRRVVRRRRP